MHINESNWPEVVGDGQQVFAAGDVRYLACRRELWDGRAPVKLTLREAGIDPIPPSQWDDWYKRLQSAKASLTELFRPYPPLDQDGTNYCWANAVCHALEIARVAAGLSFTRLSPASLGGPITGFRNVGGWPDSAAQYAQEHGIAPASVWPANAISRQYDTPESREARKLYSPELIYLDPQGPDELGSLLLLGIPVVAALNWWGHAVIYTGIARKDGQWVWEMINSWGPNWGENGRGTLAWRRGTPDDATALWAPQLAYQRKAGR